MSEEIHTPVPIFKLIMFIFLCQLFLVSVKVTKCLRGTTKLCPEAYIIIYKFIQRIIMTLFIQHLQRVFNFCHVYCVFVSRSYFTQYRPMIGYWQDNVVDNVVSVRLSVMLYIVAKRYILQQKLAWIFSYNFV